VRKLNERERAIATTAAGVVATIRSKPRKQRDLPPITNDPLCVDRITHVHAPARMARPMMVRGDVNSIRQNRTAVRSM
jgi:hypothetical protein